MCSRRLDALAIERLNGVPAHLFLLQSGERDIDGLHLVSDCVPALLHNLASLFVAHQRKLTFDLSCSFSLVDAIRADTLDLDTAFEFSPGD